MTNSTSRRPKRPNQGPRAFFPRKGNQQAQKIKKILELLNLLNFYRKLCNVEDSLLDVFNKLNDIHYVNGIVNLASYVLTKSETSVLSKGLGFYPNSGAPDMGNIIQDLDAFKRRTRWNFFFSGSNEDTMDQNTQSGVPFEHKVSQTKIYLQSSRSISIRNHVLLNRTRLT